MGASQKSPLIKTLLKISVTYAKFPISWWIFQKVPAEYKKGLILPQKLLILNRHNFGLLAPKSMRFPSKDRTSQSL